MCGDRASRHDRYIMIRDCAWAGAAHRLVTAVAVVVMQRRDASSWARAAGVSQVTRGVDGVGVGTCRWCVRVASAYVKRCAGWLLCVQVVVGLTWVATTAMRGGGCGAVKLTYRNLCAAPSPRLLADSARVRPVRWLKRGAVACMRRMHVWGWRVGVWRGWMTRGAGAGRVELAPCVGDTPRCCVACSGVASGVRWASTLHHGAWSGVYVMQGCGGVAGAWQYRAMAAE